MTPRVRFAPSPTGYLHVGGARTALYNWLFARSKGGTMILRSDDTDRERSTAEYAADILDSMRWFGLDWDEGIEVGGPHGGYRQSGRLERYQEVADRLVEEGAAYYSFATQDQLETFRNEARAAGTAPSYDGRFDLDQEIARERVSAGEKATVRFKVPRPGQTTFVDVVRGDVAFEHSQVDDFVILRSDRTPTYHLASTVDDVDYDITHVIRGEDLLSSTPKHILLTQAMGAEPATYAHLSLLMGPDGKKLSKRHGHTAISAYRDAGYLPEALINYLALLGWNPGDDDTVLPLDEMVRRFDLDTVSKNPAIFDTDKLEWMNGVYIRDLEPSEFVDRIAESVETDLECRLDDDERAILDTIAPHVQERTKLLTEAAGQVRFLLVDEVEHDETSWNKVMTKDEVPSVLETTAARLEGLGEWDLESIEGALRGMLADLEIGARKGLQPIRVAISGSTVSPPLFESIEALGRDRTLRRLEAARSKVGD
ncbi:MAG: glutamate--tRNA ligase [Actinomycetota bacterium]